MTWADWKEADTLFWVVCSDTHTAIHTCHWSASPPVIYESSCFLSVRCSGTHHKCADKIKHVLLWDLIWCVLQTCLHCLFPVSFHRKGIEIYQWKTPLNTPFQLGNTAALLYTTAPELHFNVVTLLWKEKGFLSLHILALFYAFVELSSTDRGQSYNKYLLFVTFG